MDGPAFSNTGHMKSQMINIIRLIEQYTLFVTFGIIFSNYPNKANLNSFSVKPR